MSLLLPPGTNNFVAEFTNSTYLQKLKITPPSGTGSPIVWQGSGERNHQIGDQMLATPDGNSNLSYSVNAEYSSDGGSTWQQPSLIPGGCVVGTLNMKVVISEDHADQDFNDAVVQFMWWEPLS